MKKAVNILTIIYIILLFWLTKNKDILALTTSSSIYLLFSSIFSTLEIKEKDIKKTNYLIIAIMVIFIPLTIISYFIGNILDIYNLGIINIIMSITCCLNIIIKLLRQYFEVVQNKKVTIINCYNVNEYKDNIKQILDEHQKVLNTSGEKEKDEYITSINIVN